MRSEQLHGTLDVAPGMRALVEMLRAGHLAETREEIASLALEQIHAGGCGVPTAVSINAEKLAISSGTLPEERAAEFPILASGQAIGVIRVWSTEVPLPDSTTSLVEAVAHVVGISWDRLEAARVASRLQLDLEDRVAERTEELSEAVKELEAFTYSVSHDLRAPLRAIQGFSTLLAEELGDKLSPDVDHLLDVITSSARKMGNLIDDILSLSRATRQELRFFEIDMEALVIDVLAELRLVDPGLRATFIVEPLPSAYGDPTAVRQVLTNLLGNAVKFSSKVPDPKIDVFAEHEDGRTVFVVRDNGAGFDMNYADNLFGLFQRLHSEDEFEGTGVGLAITHRLLNRHGTRIWATAAVDKGATFRFTLPEGPNDECR
jgi:signal transduction histidine kinase